MYKAPPVAVVKAPGRVGEPNGLSNAGDLPGDGSEEDDVLLVVLPDLGADPVVHGLQVPPVSDAGEEEGGVLEDVPTPGLVHQLVPEHGVPLGEGLGDEAPEGGELVEEPVVVLVQPAHRVREAGGEVVVGPGHTVALLPDNTEVVFTPN